MAQVKIKNLTQHRVYIPVPVGIMIGPAREIILSEISDDLLAQSRKISRLVEKRVIQVSIQPQDPDIDDTLETRFLAVGGLPLHGGTHAAGGVDAIDLESLRASAGGAGEVLTADGAGGASWQASTIANHAPTHQHGGADEVAVSTPAANEIPKAKATGKIDAGWIETGTTAGLIAAADDARFPTADEKAALAGTSGVPSGTNRYVTNDDPRMVLVIKPPLHAATHYKAGTDKIDVGFLETFTAPGAGYLVAADGSGSVAWATASTPGPHAGTHLPNSGSDPLFTQAAGTIQPDDTSAVGTADSFSRSDHRHAIVCATPTNIVPDDTAQEGTATSFARSDHVHGISGFAAAQGIGGGNSEGVASSFARSDHDHTIRETGDPQDLTVGAIPDNFALIRSGTAIVGVNPYNPDRAVVVAKTLLGADATSIADGIVKANALTPPPSITAPAVLVVHPGVYSTPPFTLPAYVSLVGVGGREAVILEASILTSALCSAPGDQRIEGVTLRHASGVGGIGVNVSGTIGRLLVKDCYIHDCETAIVANGAGRIVEIRETITEDGTTSVYVNGVGAAAFMFGVNMTNFTTGLHIGPAGGAVGGTALRVADDPGFTTHVRVEAASSQLDIIDSIFREDKTDYHPSADIRVVHGSDIAGDVALQVTAEFHVGSEDRPRESAFGGGDSHTRNVAYLRNTNLEAGTWSNITTQLAYQDAVTAPLFSGTLVGNSFYVGGDQPFSGLKAEMTTARVGGAIVLEYWNGAAWVQIPHLSSDANFPYMQYAQDALSRVNSEQIRFGTAAITGWTTKSLNGITKYWIRWRVTTALTTIPAADRVKVHTNRTEINADGTVEYFGSAEPQRQLMWHRSLMEELDGFAQPDATIDIAITPTLSVRARNNRWQDGNKDGSTTFLQATPGLDTSRPIVYDVGWAPEATGAGNVELQLDVVTINPGNVLGALPYTAQLSQIVTGPFVDNTLQVTRFTFTVPNLTTTGSLVMALYRDASGGNLDDTFGSDAMHVYSAVYGTFWR